MTAKVLKEGGAVLSVGDPEVPGCGEGIAGTLSKQEREGFPTRPKGAVRSI